MSDVPNQQTDKTDSSETARDYPFTPLAARPPAPVPDGRSSLFSGLAWFLSLATTLLILRFFVPYLIEHVQYSITRGRQRAEVEVASAGLEAFPLESLSKAYQLISKRIRPSVVHIEVTSRENELSRTLDLPRRERSRRGRQGAGSGLVVDSDGYILTNHHVIEDATEIRVTLSDGRVKSADVVGFDRPTDLAVLKVPADDLIPAAWGNSEKLEVGELVWTVGSPFGLQQSVTSGILSAKNRTRLSRERYVNFLQTDAPINPGSSGGPLVDVRGHVVGINTAIVGDGDFFAGISLAIPSNAARTVYDQLRAKGQVVRGWLGVQLHPDDDACEHGALITGLSLMGTISPAGEAGIRAGDIIVSWNGATVDDAPALKQAIGRTGVGSVAEVGVLRDDTELTFTVTVGRRPVVLDR